MSKRKERNWPLISVVIVTYNSAAKLRPTLDALFKQDYANFEAVLVDNVSKDDSLAIAREYEPRGLRIIANDTNRGFSGGNNDGVAATAGPLIFLLNPDAVVKKKTLFHIARAFGKRRDMGILGTKTLSEDEETLLHCGGEIGYPAHTRAYGRGEPDRGQSEEVREVEFVTGAALAITRKLWNLLGGLDESFNPAYYEDTDLCHRCRKAGRKVLYWPIPMVHHENVSMEYKSRAFLELHHRNRLWFMAKNFSLPELLFLALPAEIHWAFSIDSKGFRKPMLRLYKETFFRFLAKRWQEVAFAAAILAAVVLLIVDLLG